MSEYTFNISGNIEAENDFYAAEALDQIRNAIKRMNQEDENHIPIVVMDSSVSKGRDW